MARYIFREGKEYKARLCRVQQRPIENSAHMGFRLLRLEFEMFVESTETKVLSSTGKIACRDIVVGPAVDPSKDSSLAAYAAALKVLEPSRVKQWLELDQKRIWVTISFGPLVQIDLRNSFKEISPFDAGGWQVVPWDYNLDEWVTVGEAADDLECSPATIRRRIAEWEPEWGHLLVKRTVGNQRRINLRCLRNLWPNKS